MKNRPLLLFYLLVMYVILQFGWWSWLLIRQNNEIYELKTQINLVMHKDNALVLEKGNELEEKLFYRRMMIGGEGAVFLVLLVLGFIIVRSSFRREASLAQRQTNFMHSVTHELKSPIASTRLAIETLQKHDLDKAKQQDLLKNALADADRLHSLVDNILLAARIEGSAYHLNFEKLNLSEYCETAVKEAQRMFAPTQKIETNIQPNVDWKIDKTVFASILLNLIENAIKYSPSDSSIQINVKLEGAGAIISVEDGGPGVPETEKENIFKKFYRVGNEETRKTKGTGLGLYLVKYLVEKHNGKIMVKDAKPGGCIFEVTLYG